MLRMFIFIIYIVYFSFQSAVFANFVCDFTIPNINLCPSKSDSVTILATITEIPDSVFYNCHTLTSVVINEGVTGLGDFMFRESVQ